MNKAKMFRRSGLAASISIIVSGMSTVYAQDADQVAQDEAVEEIVVTGLRRSLEDAISTKRDNSSIVEALSAEDIGKLPAVSIADNLAKLPGLTVQRLNGRGQVVNIRGLSPDFGAGLLNGREQVSVGDNRGVEFDQYPGDLLQNVTVYKTPDASLIGQGLSGTIDMETVKPLAYGEQKITLNARYTQGEYDLSSFTDNKGGAYSASYIDQFADDTIGIVLGYSSMDAPSQGKSFNSWGYYNGDGEGNSAIGGGRVYTRAADLDRETYVGVLEFQPNDALNITTDAYYSTFDENQIKHGLALCLACGAEFTALETENGVVTHGIYDGVKSIVENNQFKRDSDLFAIGVNVDYMLNDDWNLEFDIAHSEVDRSDVAEFETTGGTGPAGEGALDTIEFWTGPNGTTYSSELDYSNIDYTDPSSNPIYITSPAGWGDPNALAPYQPAGQFGYNKVFDVNDELDSFKMIARRELSGAFSAVEFGYSYQSRSKSRQANEGVITSNVVDPETGLLLDRVEIPSSIVGSTDLSFAGLGDVVSFDPQDLLASGVIQQGAYLYNDILAKSWTVEEDISVAYVQVDLDTQFVGLPLTGNFGLQLQAWDQSSNGQGAIGSGEDLQISSYQGGDSDSEILPSLNLTLELEENQLLRFSAARTLVRPRMDEMKASREFYYDTSKADQINSGDADPSDLNASPWSGTGGNPELAPWVANGFDLSYEYYFADAASYASIAYFYKDLETYIYNANTVYDFDGVPCACDPSQEVDVSEGYMSTPQNGDGGMLQGIEMSFSLSAAMLHNSLEGFGVIGTYSHNDSDIEPNGPGSNSRLPGLSEDVYSWTLYYENAGFSARVNQRYRSDYVGEVSGFGGARTGNDLESETVLKAQISYDFQPGSGAEGLSLVLQGSNLTDEPFRSVDAATGLPTEYQTYGATYSFGASYTF